MVVGMQSDQIRSVADMWQSSHMAALGRKTRSLSHSVSATEPIVGMTNSVDGNAVWLQEIHDLEPHRHVLLYCRMQSRPATEPCRAALP